MADDKTTFGLEIQTTADGQPVKDLAQDYRDLKSAADGAATSATAAAASASPTAAPTSATAAASTTSAVQEATQAVAELQKTAEAAAPALAAVVAPQMDADRPSALRDMAEQIEEAKQAAIAAQQPLEEVTDPKKWQASIEEVDLWKQAAQELEAQLKALGLQTKNLTEDQKDAKQGQDALANAANSWIKLRLVGNIQMHAQQLHTLTTEAISAGGALGAAFENAKPAIDASVASIEVMTSAIRTAVLSGSPLLGVFAGLEMGALAGVRAYKEMEDELRKVSQGATNFTNLQQHLNDVHEQFVHAVQARNFAKQFDDEARELSKTISLLEQADQLAKAREQTAATIAQIRANTASRSGQDPTQAQAAQIVAGVTSQLADLAREVEIAGEKAKATQTEVERADNAVQFDSDRSDAHLAELNKKLEDAKAAVDVANAEVDNLKALNEAKKQQIIQTAEDKLQDLGTNVNSAIKDLAQKALDDVSAQAEASGKQLTAAVSGTFTTLSKLISDGTPDSTHVYDIASKIADLRRFTDLKDGATYDALSQLIQKVEQQARDINDLKQKAAALNNN